jgi:hypothetical protein
VNDKTHFQSDVANVQYGDVSKVAKFEVASLASDGQTVLTATAKPPKGRKYAVLLLGTLDKDDNPLDFDVDSALASIGYIPTQEVKALVDAVEEPDDMDRFWVSLGKLIGNEPLTTPQQDDAE